MAARAPSTLRALSKHISGLVPTGSTYSGRIPSTVNTARTYCTAVATVGSERERRFVRISGVTSYAGAEDIKLFLKQNDVNLPDPTTSEIPLASGLKQGTSDVFQNASVWVYDAGNAERATDAAAKLNGHVVGMKLVRAAAVDLRVISDLVGAAPQRRRKTLRRHLHVIAPSPDEYGRTVIVTNINVGLNPKSVWGFFGAYDITDVRMLRRSGVAAVVFRNVEEAERAARERNNVSLQGRGRVHVKMFD